MIHKAIIDGMTRELDSLIDGKRYIETITIVPFPEKMIACDNCPLYQETELDSYCRITASGDEPDYTLLDNGERATVMPASKCPLIKIQTKTEIITPEYLDENRKMADRKYTEIWTPTR